MKKLGKNNTSEANTIQAYSCECSCSCSCADSMDGKERVMGEAQGTWNYSGANLKTISILN